MMALPGKAALRRAIWRTGLLVVVSSACGCGTPQWVRGAEEIRPVDAAQGDDALYHLDFRNPSIQQAIETHGASPQAYRFVQIEVAEVTNPKKHPLSFEVRFQAKDDVINFLGSFSLYPSDNPGKFIVPTQGRLRGEGAIVLSMATPDTIGDQDTTRVAIKKMRLVNG
jgi:hypothetical protein